MKKILFLLSFLFVLVASEVVAATFDWSRAKFEWEQPLGGGPVTHYKFYCAGGQNSGPPYTIVTTVPIALVTQVTPVTTPPRYRYPVKDVVSGQGEFECAVSALNIDLESGLSNEVFFSVVVGASVPSNLTVVQ